MTEQEIQDKFEDIQNLVTEALYIFRELKEENESVLKVKKMEYLEPVRNLILMLSELRGRGLKDMPIETVYKLLYYDYRKLQEENVRLKEELRKTHNLQA